MGYTALYRKYRPKTFDEVAGQDVIKRTLINQIKNNRIGHAYLFTGSRGTGKTTIARIFARAVNCLSHINGSPCGVCNICKIDDNIDIIEIDGASSNRVEAVRELKEQVKYPPVSSKYKVYIVDEAHMLTDSSYNALLKTLEEPPNYVIFILATTEPHKIPPTIMSRCMRFDFKLVPADKIADIISQVFLSSNIKASKEAIGLIARSGMGSVRDALSIADMCAGFSAKEVTYNDVLELLGSADIIEIGELAANILKGNINSCLGIVNTLAESGKSINIIARDLTTYFRNLGIVKTCQNPNDILGLPKEVFQQLQEHCELSDIDKITVCIDIFSSLDQELRFGLNPRITLENAVIKSTRLLVNTPNAILARLNELEKKITNINFSTQKEQNITPKDNTTQAKTKTPAFEIQAKDTQKTLEQEDRIYDTQKTSAQEVKTQDISKTPLEETKVSNISEKKDKKEDQLEKDQDAKDQNITLEDIVPPQNIQGHFIGPDDIFDDEISTQSKAQKTLGELAYKLREKGEMLLYFQITNSIEKIRMQNGALIGTVYDQNAYKLLSDPKNIHKIEELLDGIKFSVVVAEPEPELREQTIKRLKELAQDKLIIK